MAELKTKVNKASVSKFLSVITDVEKRKDCLAISFMLEKITKAESEMWDTSIVGFGCRKYIYAKPVIRIFAVGYEAELREGEPRLGEPYVEMKWVDIETFKPEEYFTGGWLKGVQDFLAHKRSMKF